MHAWRELLSQMSKKGKVMKLSSSVASIYTTKCLFSDSIISTELGYQTEESLNAHFHEDSLAILAPDFLEALEHGACKRMQIMHLAAAISLHVASCQDALVHTFHLQDAKT